MKNPLKQIKITQLFGANPDMYKRYGMKGHNGLDFRATVGTPVYAAHDGALDNIDTSSGYGKHILIKNKEYVTCYAHLSNFKEQTNPNVITGDLIGYTGNTGNSTGPHLHFGVRQLDINGNIKDYDNGYWGWQNPLPYFEPEAEAKSLINRIFNIFSAHIAKPKGALAIIPDDHGKLYLIINGEKHEAVGKDKIIEAMLVLLAVGVSKSDISKIPTGEKI